MQEHRKEHAMYSYAFIILYIWKSHMTMYSNNQQFITVYNNI